MIWQYRPKISVSNAKSPNYLINFMNKKVIFYYYVNKNIHNFMNKISLCCYCQKLTIPNENIISHCILWDFPLESAYPLPAYGSLVH